jgi:multiple sugar transport system permease protein
VRARNRSSGRNQGRSVIKRSVERRQRISGFLFVLPVVLFFLVFNLYPMGNAFFVSLFKYDLLTPKTFIGIQNYLSAFQDKHFINSVLLTIKFLGIGGPITLAISFLLAIAMQRSFKMRDFFRAIYFLPAILSLIASSIIWKVLLHPYGPLNAYLGLAVPWLTRKQYALYGIMIMAIWRGLGYYMVLFLAGLESIPREFYEAASIDGTNGPQRFRFITFPLMKPVISFILIILVITGLKFFEPMYIMTRGGPDNATEVLTLNIYQNAFQFFKMGYASAMSVLMFFAIILVTIFQLRLFRTEERL